VCDLETSLMRRYWLNGGAVAPKKERKKKVMFTMQQVHFIVRYEVF